MRLLVCATHPWNTNGYSLVMSNLVEHMATEPDVERIFYFGFQNVSGENSRNKREMPAKVELYDALANEQPRKQGFGEDLIKDYVLEKSPDVVIIFNDSIVIERLTAKLSEIADRKFRVVVYQDLVYEHMKKRFVDQLNTRVDTVLAFTPYWKQHMEEQGVTTPIEVVRHGFDPRSKFPVDRKIARRFFGLKNDDFVVLNLNRNQPRKRWDIVIKAFAEFVSRHRGEAIKLLVGTAVLGSWDLLSIFERELSKRDISIDEGRRHLVVIDTPQKLSDDDVNVLMNCADIGVSAADGEGFGLCNFEHAAIGRPQVVSNVGGMKDFFTEDRAILCDPVLAYYVDSSRDGVGGEAHFIDYKDLTDGMELYYSNPDLRKKHGEAARKHILEHYKWSDQAAVMAQACRKLAKEMADKHIATSVPDEMDVIPDVGDVIEQIEQTPVPACQSEPEPELTLKPDLQAKSEELQVTDLQQQTKTEVPTVSELDMIRQQLATLTSIVEKLAAK